MEPRTTLLEPIAKSELDYVITFLTTDLNALRHGALKAELEKRLAQIMSLMNIDTCFV